MERIDEQRKEEVSSPSYAVRNIRLEDSSSRLVFLPRDVVIARYMQWRCVSLSEVGIIPNG